MPVVDVTTDVENRRLVMAAHFTAPPERVWQVYADPRQLEKVWGPPGSQATFVDHELRPGGRMTYFMTGPEGQRFHGYWDVLEVDQPRTFSFDDGFANEEFAPDPALPVSRNTYSLTAQDGGTRVVHDSVYPSAEALQQVLDMGVVEGATAAISQIDDVLAADRG